MITDNQQTVQKIYDVVRWLENNGSSQAITDIVIKLDELAIQSMWLAEGVSDAYAARNDAEENYKHAYAKAITNSAESVAKAEKRAFVDNEALRKEFLMWDNLYQKFRMKLDRIETVLDTHRQRVSLLKQMDLKNV